MTDDKNPLDESADRVAALTDEEVRTLPPDYALRKIIGDDVNLKQIFSSENIETAQAAINEHRQSFIEWVMKDIDQLEESYTKATANPAGSDADIRKLARAAFIIKSQAGTFGFDLATQTAKSLDDFCNQHFHHSAEHMMVVRKHIDTIIVVFQKNITGDGGEVGKELSDNLLKLVDKFKNK